MNNGTTKAMKAKQRKRVQDGRKRPEFSASPRKNFERYMALARDAVSSGNAIESENYYQHAEHYLRLMAMS